MLAQLFGARSFPVELLQQLSERLSSGRMMPGPQGAFSRSAFIGQGHVWTAPWQELFDGCRYGRVRSRVRPFGAALMTAGPNAFRRSGPNRKRALDGALTREGLSDPWIRHVCITSFSPSQFRSWALG